MGKGVHFSDLLFIYLKRYLEYCRKMMILVNKEGNDILISIFSVYRFTKMNYKMKNCTSCMIT